MPAQFCAVTFVTPQGQNHAIGDALGYSSLIDPSEGLARMARSPVTQANWSLAGITIFADLSGKALERVQQCCSWRRYQPGESIVGYLDSSDECFYHFGRGPGHHLFAGRQGGELSRARSGRSVWRISCHRPRPSFGKRGGAEDLYRSYLARRCFQGTHKVRTRGGAGATTTPRHENSGVDGPRL